MYVIMYKIDGNTLVNLPKLLISFVSHSLTCKPGRFFMYAPCAIILYTAICNCFAELPVQITNYIKFDFEVL